MLRNNNLTKLENETDVSLTASNQTSSLVADTMDPGWDQLLSNKGNNFPKSTKMLRSPTLKVPNVSNDTLQLKQAAAVATASRETTDNPQLEEATKALADSRQENKELNKAIEWMQHHIQLLEEEVKNLKHNLKMDYQTGPEVPFEVEVLNQENNNHETKGGNSIEYLTDEEDLERETNWIIKKSQRALKKQKLQEVNSSNKRKAESSPEMSTSVNISGAKVNQLPTFSRTKKEKPPPPINITHVDKFSVIQALMKEVTEKEYKLVSLNNNV